MIAGYARTSSQSQAEQNGTQAQRHELEQWASARGITPVWYIDEAQSGKSMDRPEFNRLMADVRAGKVGTIVAYSLSRLGRNVRGLLDLVDEINQGGVQLVLLKDAIDTSTPTGRCFFTILAAMAQMERELIAERITSGIKAKRAKGLRWGRNKFKYDHDELVAMVKNVGYKETFTRTGASPTTVFRAVAKAKAAQTPRA